MVKVTFKSTGGAEPPPPPPPPSRAQSFSLKLKVKPDTPTSSPSTQQPPADGASSQAKPKRKYTRKPKADNDGGGVPSPEVSKSGKKRPRKDDEEDELAISAKRPAKPERTQSITIKLPTTAVAAKSKAMGNLPKLNTGPSKISFKKHSLTTPRLKVKALGRPPHRPLGVGYDSEAEEVETDPAIEHQFILRMEPGDDCDYLRTAIAASNMKPKEGEKRINGPDVWMRFFDKDGRRGVVSVRGNLYATSLLDLPCVVEGMKSWDKRGFFKTADICQILLVLGRVKTEGEAKVVVLPSEVDDKNWQYPHGLTPPMHYVRKRRFRKRINIRTIERVENDVEELFKKDKLWGDAEGGTIKFEWVDPDAEEIENGDVIDGYEYEAQGNEGGEDEDGEGEDGMYEMEEVDDEFTRMMEEGLTTADADGEGNIIPGENGNFHASPDNLHPPETAMTPASGGTTSATEGESGDEGSDDAASTDGIVEEDDDEIARRQEREQQLEEIEELKREVASAEEKWRKQVNPLLKNRAAQDMKSLRTELEVKMNSLKLPGED